MKMMNVVPKETTLRKKQKKNEKTSRKTFRPAVRAELSPTSGGYIREESRALRRRTRESQREGSDTDGERSVKSELRGRMGGVGGGRSETTRELREKRSRLAIFFAMVAQPAVGTGVYLLERLAAARRGTRVIGDNPHLRLLLTHGFHAERRADGGANGAASAKARDARRRNGVVYTERERACAGASARAHRGVARRRRGADGGTD